MTQRRKWTEEEDQALKHAVEQYEPSWGSVAELYNELLPIKPRTRKQCRERWSEQLDPSLNLEQFTDAERQILFQLHQEHGNCWTDIAEQMPGRSANCIKNEFYSRLSKESANSIAASLQIKDFNGL